MLSILLSSTLLLSGALAGITDLNCTESSSGSPKFAPSAVSCNNKLPDATCLVLYGTAVKVNDDSERNETCAGNPVDPHLVQAAVEHCPKTCGYCCLTPAFACDDKLQPRIPCASVTQEMCTNAAWKSILEEDCPKTCGLCDSGAVICGSSPNCVNWIRNGFCTSTYYTLEHKMRYCGRECGLC